MEVIRLGLLRKAEDPDGDTEDEDVRQWQRGPWQLAKLVASSPPGRFLDLPSRFDIHEWAIMEEFSRSVKPETIREDLLRAIHGGPA